MKPGQPTYEQQWQKITSAYLNKLLNPYIECACFIGNILSNRRDWSGCRRGEIESGEGYLYPTSPLYKRADLFIAKQSNNLYTPNIIVTLENNFLKILHINTPGKVAEWYGGKDVVRHPNYENALYEAMTSTLELLRQIHEAAGDETAKEITLQKRELQPA